MSYHVYVVECSDGSLYTGYTDDLDKRVCEHNESKKGAKYTRSRRPVHLVYTEMCGSKSDAMKREAAIKRMSRVQKIALIKNSLK